MTEIWCKESLIDYVTALIRDLDDAEYTLDERRGMDYLEIEIERVRE